MPLAFPGAGVRAGWEPPFSSLLPGAGDTLPCQVKSPLSWLELLLARSWRPPDGTWAGKGQVMPVVPLPGGGCAVHPRAPAPPALWACEDVYPWQSPLLASLSLILSPSPLLSLSLSITHSCPHPSSIPVSIPFPFPVPFPVPILILNPVPIPVPIPIPYRVRGKVVRVERDSLRVAGSVPARG